MKRFIEWEDRTQVTLLPECLDDFIAEDNSVRVVDAFVEELDLDELGFDGVQPLARVGLPTTRRCRSRSTSTDTLIAFNRADAWSVNASETSS
jgi:hypothetical protein